MAKVKEDTWAFQPIGAPFPDKPMRVKGEQNQYVALWYKHGRPVCGRAWNDGGQVQCSFPYNGKELTGKRDLGGEIQILQYDAHDQWIGFDKMGYWYQWVQYKDRQQPGFDIVRCGQSVPILAELGDKAEGKALLGNLSLATEEACFSFGGKEIKLTGIPVQAMWVIVRDLKKPPPPNEAPKHVDDQWIDAKYNDPFPQHLVSALGRPLQQEDGSKMEQYVALWYKHGEPVMGRCWNFNGRLSATFGWDGKEFTGDVGSMQLLQYEQGRCAYEFKWLPFKEAIANYRNNTAWQPVRVGDVAPCVLKNDKGHERLGKVLLSQEKAGAGFNGKEEIVQGPAVQGYLVLCRDPPNTKNK